MSALKRIPCTACAGSEAVKRMLLDIILYVVIGFDRPDKQQLVEAWEALSEGVLTLPFE